MDSLVHLPFRKRFESLVWLLIALGFSLAIIKVAGWQAATIAESFYIRKILTLQLLTVGVSLAFAVLTGVRRDANFSVFGRIWLHVSIIRLKVSALLRAIPCPRFRFSLSFLFALVTIVAIATSWINHSLSWIKDRNESIRKGEFHLSKNWCGTGLPPRPRAPYGLGLFGEYGHREIFVDSTDERQISRAQRLFPEAAIRCNR